MGCIVLLAGVCRRL